MITSHKATTHFIVDKLQHILNDLNYITEVVALAKVEEGGEKYSELFAFCNMFSKNESEDISDAKATIEAMLKEAEEK